MGKVIVWDNNGKVAVTSFNPGIEVDENDAIGVPNGVRRFVTNKAEFDGLVYNDLGDFRSAWRWKDDGKVSVDIDMDEAKEVCHCRRRAKRAEEFAPLDVQTTIPAQAAAAETARQVVRDRHAKVQVDIDAATTPEELKVVIDAEGI